MKLRDVVAGDVLDHPPAALDDGAVGPHHGQADQEVAHRPVSRPVRAGRPGGDQPSDGRGCRAAPGRGGRTAGAGGGPRRAPRASRRTPPRASGPPARGRGCGRAARATARRRAAAAASPTRAGRHRRPAPRRARERSRGRGRGSRRRRSWARRRSGARRPPPCGRSRGPPRGPSPGRPPGRAPGRRPPPARPTCPPARACPPRPRPGRRRAAPDGNTFRGFMSPRGSKTRRTACITSRSSGLKRSASFSALSRPTPCSPVTVPPSSMQAWRISSFASSARANSPGDPLVVADHRVEVPVPGVEHVGDDEPVAGGDRLDLRHDGRQLGARHHGVLEDVVVRDAPDRAGGLLPALPEERALGVVPRDAHRQRAPVAADPRHRLGLAPRPRRRARRARSGGPPSPRSGSRRGCPPRPPG